MYGCLMHMRMRRPSRVHSSRQQPLKFRFTRWSSFFTIFCPNYSFETMPLDVVLLPLAVAAMFVGSLVAIFQDDVKRMLAYSSVAQIG